MPGFEKSTALNLIQQKPASHAGFLSGSLCSLFILVFAVIFQNPHEHSANDAALLFSALCKFSHRHFACRYGIQGINHHVQRLVMLFKQAVQCTWDIPFFVVRIECALAALNICSASSAERPRAKTDLGIIPRIMVLSIIGFISASKKPSAVV